MTSLRRNPLASHIQDKNDMLTTIPIPVAAAPKTRRVRDWEKTHRTYSYFVPRNMKKKKQELQELVARIAFDVNRIDGIKNLSHGLTVNEVASNLVSYALDQIDSGGFELEFKPIEGRMAVMWSIAKHKQPRELLPMPEKAISDLGKKIYIGYRWSNPLIHKRIRELGGSVASGEILLKLLEYGCEAYIAGEIVPTVTHVITKRGTLDGWGKHAS